MTDETLHGYFRSTAAWRVRIALNLKGLSPKLVAHHLRRGEQRSPDYLQLNPHGLVPTYEIDGAPLTQSLAIIEYLDETHPAPPLLPADPLQRARVRAFALTIACDIHPLQNLRVLQKLRTYGLDQDQVQGLGTRRDRTGPGCLRRAGRQRAGPVLLRVGADPCRPLPRAATLQCTAVRGQDGLRPPARNRGVLHGVAGLSGGARRSAS